jgi:hypothetical protein
MLRLLRRSIPAAIVFSVFFLGSSALAHRAYNGWLAVWTDGPRCVNEKVTLDHPSGAPNGQFITEMNVEKELNTVFGTVNCSVGWTRPPGYLRLRLVMLKLTGGTWGVCYDTGYSKNNVNAQGLVFNIYSGTSPRCGNGYYRTQGYAHTLINGTWRGGPLAIPAAQRHYLPCPAGSTC